MIEDSKNWRGYPAILLCGKSGTGKSAVAERYCEMYHGSVLNSYTSRPKRFPEEKGHIFITEAEFNNIEQDQMIAYTLFDGYQYCATIDQFEHSTIYIIDPTGIVKFRKDYKGSKKYVVVELTASDSLRKSRMEERGDSADSIRKRMENDDKKFFEINPDLTIDTDDINVDKVAHQIFCFLRNTEDKNFADDAKHYLHAFELSLYYLSESDKSWIMSHQNKWFSEISGKGFMIRVDDELLRIVKNDEVKYINSIPERIRDFITFTGGDRQNDIILFVEGGSTYYGLQEFI